MSKLKPKPIDEALIEIVSAYDWQRVRLSTPLLPSFASAIPSCDRYIVCISGGIPQPTTPGIALVWADVRDVRAGLDIFRFGWNRSREWVIKRDGYSVVSYVDHLGASKLGAVGPFKEQAGLLHHYRDGVLKEFTDAPELVEPGVVIFKSR